MQARYVVMGLGRQAQFVAALGGMCPPSGRRGVEGAVSGKVGGKVMSEPASRPVSTSRVRRRVCGTAIVRREIVRAMTYEMARW